MFDVLFLDAPNALMTVVLMVDIFFAVSFFRYKNHKYLVHLFCVMLWVFITILFRYTNNEQVDLVLVNLIYLLGLAIPYSFLIFILNHKKIILQKFLIYKKYIHLTFFLYLISFYGLIDSVKKISFSEKNLVFSTPYFIFFFTLLTLYLSISFMLMYFWYKKSSKIEKSSVRIIFIGSFVPAVISWFFNVVLPFLGYNELYWVGQISSIFLTTCVFYAILKYKLFDIKSSGAYFIKFIFYFSFTYIAFYVGVLLQEIAFGSVLSKQSMFLGIFLAPTFAFLLFQLDKVTDVINYFIFGNLNKHQDLYAEISDFINSNLEDEKIITFVNQKLGEFMELKKASVLGVEAVSKKIRDKLDNLSPNLREIYKVEDEEIAKRFPNIFAVVKFKTKDEKEYFFLCQSKEFDSRISKLDMNLLRSVASQVEYSMDRSGLYKKYVDYSKQLEKEVNLKTESLNIQKQTLEQLLKGKEEMLHIVNHQLNTPISIIKSSIAMYKDEIWPKEKFIKVANFEVDRVTKTVAQFLTVNKVVEEDFKLNKTKSDLNTLIRTLIDEKTLLRKVRESGIKINFTEKDNLPSIYCDLEKMTEVVSNLLENAINYSKKDIDVSLDLDSTEKNLVFRVKDYGIGIPKEPGKKLFDIFMRLDNAKNVRPDGSGLGLYVCRKIVEKHGGKIWAESEGENKGSTFFVELPLVSEVKQ